MLFPFHLKLEMFFFFYLSFSKFWLKKTQLPKDIVILNNDFYEALIYTTMIKSTELSTLFSWPLFNIFFPLFLFHTSLYFFSISFFKSQSHGCSFFFSITKFRDWKKPHKAVNSSDFTDKIILSHDHIKMLHLSHYPYKILFRVLFV